MNAIIISFVCGFIAFPILAYIGIPIFKKWLVKKWKLEPKKEKAENANSK